MKTLRLVVLLILLLDPAGLLAGERPFALPVEMARAMDSLFGLSTVESRAEVFGDSSAVYFGAVFRTVRVSFDTLVRRLREPHKATASMGMIRRFEKIPMEPLLAPFGTYDFEAKALMARGWCLVNLDTLLLDTAGTFSVVLNGCDNPVLVRVFEAGHGGFFSVKLDRFHMRWRIERRGSSSARVGVVTWMTPRAYVPHWLYRFIATRALPGALEDLEKGLARKGG